MPKSFHASSLQSLLLIAIVIAQLLAPLLHGHFGESKQTGFHFDTGVSAVTAVATATADAAPGVKASSHHDTESFAVGVETAIGPLTLSLLLQSAAIVVGTALLGLLAASIHRLIHPACRPRRAARMRTTRALGLPPPAHAPPLFS